jgi:hypothetical protein
MDWRARWRCHVWDALQRGSDFPFHKALRKYGPSTFRTEILEVMSTRAGALRAERIWIRELGTFGDGGYNATTGGDGAFGHVVSAEARARMSAAKKGRPVPASVLAAATAANKKRTLSPERKKQLAAAAKAANTGRKRDPAAVEKSASAIRGRKYSPEHRAAAAAGRASHKHSEETKAKLRGRKHSEEARRKMREAAKRRWNGQVQ